jgi:hypothetical protein
MAEFDNSLQKTVDDYEMTLSRLTVDKLGVKLYDKVSAVVSELIANAYDADAEHVRVKLPLNRALATKTQEGIDRKGYIVEVIDDGHGMTPAEAQEYYMEIGRDRREHDGQGKYTRKKNRAVMGRKGIGKLAPFGVCERMEVISAGGEETEDGYLVSHFKMDYDEIVADTDEPIELEKGDKDGTYQDESGTTVRLKKFRRKRVPDKDTFHRQLASRFVFAETDFEITVEDIREDEPHPSETVDPFSVDKVEETLIDLSERPIETESGETLHPDGWLAMAKDSYDNEEMAGVRIYCRNKIVATTRDFEQPAGFTGEFVVRSYLVGEVKADFLDRDNGEDYIRSDRQGIIWESEYGRALKNWGAELIKEIGKRSRKPRRQRTRDKFKEKANFENELKKRYNDDTVRDAARNLAESIGGFANEDELEDQTYVSQLTDVILSVAPHRALLNSFQEFREAAEEGDVSLEEINKLFDQVSVAEIASYSQIATERVNAIEELEKIVIEGGSEDKFQQLLADAPWLIDPAWSVITETETLKTFRDKFERYYQEEKSGDIDLAIINENKIPDFTLISTDDKIHIVEIKKEGHELNNSDFDRLTNYVEAFDDFLEENPTFRDEFSDGYQIDLVCDGVNLTDYSNKQLFDKFLEEEKVRRIPWNRFLMRAKKAHQEFLDAAN